MSTAAIVAIKRKKILQKFRDAAAFDEGSAINAPEHNIRRSFIFKRLTSEGIILPAGKDLYYLDQERERQVAKRQRVIVLLVCVVLLAAALIGFFFIKR